MKIPTRIPKQSPPSLESITPFQYIAVNASLSYGWSDPYLIQGFESTQKHGCIVTTHR